MIKVIKNPEVYSPEYMGIRDIVVAADKIEGIYENVKIPEDFVDIEVIDAHGLIVVPGFIDNHVHILGGGGEGGFSTRTPEIKISQITSAGITTVIGCLGTDDVCRNINSLYAKACGLEAEGISTFIYTGGYEIPIKTLTGSPKSDIMMIDKVIGVGEIAISDNRSAQPTYDQFVNTIALSRVGGMLSGKSGVVNVHMGSGDRKMGFLFKMLQETEIPSSQVLPTHCNRKGELFIEAISYAREGGLIDLTTSFDPNHLDPGEVRASEGLKRLLMAGVKDEHITFSSDGNGSMPKFNEKNEFLGLGICSVVSLLEEVRSSVLEFNIPLETALKTVTENPARIFKLSQKGKLEKGRDGDILFLTKDNLEVVSVMAKGKFHVRDGKQIVKGTFEEAEEHKLKGARNNFNIV